MILIGSPSYYSQKDRQTQGYSKGRADINTHRVAPLLEMKDFNLLSKKSFAERHWTWLQVLGQQILGKIKQFQYKRKSKINKIK